MEKCVHAYDYVDLKSREYLRTHTKPRHLGDVDGRYRYLPRSCTPTLVGSLVNLELPETRAINTNTANTIIANQTKQIQSTYEKTNRVATLDAWSYPPLGEETVVEVPSRPHTAAGVYQREPGKTTKLQLRPFSTGSPGQRVHPRTPPQLYSYMVAKAKRRHSSSSSGGKNIRLKTVTTALQSQWEEEDRIDQQQQSPRRAKSQNAKRFDSFAGQWLSFAGGTEDEGGVLDAFTGEAADEYYNVEFRIGANIANQLNKGNKIRVGKNGVLQSNTLKVNKWKNENPHDSTYPTENISSGVSTSTDDSSVQKKPPIKMVPLSWDDQLAKPDVKVVGVKEKELAAQKADLCDRRPVIYKKLVKDANLPQHRTSVKSDSNYKIRQRTKNKRNMDGTESLNNRITMISVDQVNEDRDSMCSEEYEELLHRSLQTADIKSGLETEPEEDSQRDMLEGRHVSQEQFVPLTSSSLSTNERQAYLMSKESEDFMPPIVGHRRSMGQDEVMKVESPSRHMSNITHDGFVKQEQWPSRQQSPTSTPRQLSASYLPTRQLSARPATNTPRMSARTRSQQKTRSAPPKRAQSSPTRRTRPHYQFDESPSPRNLHSPRPNLVKAGQLPRSGISSINANSSHDGDHEYIKISHQLMPGGGGAGRNSRSPSAVAAPVGGDSWTGKSDPSDTVSIDSMDVNKGDHDHGPIVTDHHREECTCSPDIKRALSAAMSHLSSHASEPSGPVINIPTADSAESDMLSNRGGGSVMSFFSDKSDPLDGFESPFDSGRQSPSSPINQQLKNNDLHKPIETINDQTGSTAGLPDSATNTLPPNVSERREKQEVEFFINQIDGLNFNQTDMEEIGHGSPPSRLLSAADRKRRTVKFADEQDSMSTSVPQCTPMSTPRENNSDSELPS